MPDHDEPAARRPGPDPVDTVPHLRLAMRLPRQPETVASVRRQVGRALAGIGVTDDCRDDILLALTEACSNAVEHARSASDYELVITVDPHRCVVDVIDSGVGVDPARLQRVSDLLVRRGRGLQLIRARSPTSWS